jgi:hypothetical protein
VGVSHFVQARKGELIRDLWGFSMPKNVPFDVMWLPAFDISLALASRYVQRIDPLFLSSHYFVLTTSPHFLLIALYTNLEYAR